MVNFIGWRVRPSKMLMEIKNGLLRGPQGREQNAQLHRVEGPAIEYADGRKDWYQKEQLHRVDGPAIEYPDGRKEWYQNGQLHRMEGPAIEDAYGDKHWSAPRTAGPRTKWSTSSSGGAGR